MLTRRALLAAVPALALAPCGPTNPPQPPQVFVGQLDMGQDLHGRDPDPLIAMWPTAEELRARAKAEIASGRFNPYSPT